MLMAGVRKKVISDLLSSCPKVLFLSVLPHISLLQCFLCNRSYIKVAKECTMLFTMYDSQFLIEMVTHELVAASQT